MLSLKHTFMLVNCIALRPVIASKHITEPHRSVNNRMVCLRCVSFVNGINNLAQEVQLLEHGVLNNSSTSTSVVLSLV